VHYGVIASGDVDFESGVARDQAKEELGVICFEREAAGLMDNFPCLVIRGICDYADSHTNLLWQGYAAATAAACAKELLEIMSPQVVKETAKIVEVVLGSLSPYNYYNCRYAYVLISVHKMVKEVGQAFSELRDVDQAAREGMLRTCH
jgi:hypothetical protein